MTFHYYYNVITGIPSLQQYLQTRLLEKIFNLWFSTDHFTVASTVHTRVIIVQLVSLYIPACSEYVKVYKVEAILHLWWKWNDEMMVF